MKACHPCPCPLPCYSVARAGERGWLPLAERLLTVRTDAYREFQPAVRQDNDELRFNQAPQTLHARPRNGFAYCWVFTCACCHGTRGFIVRSSARVPTWQQA